MDVIMIVLRLVHIIAGMFWAGAAVMIAFYLEPTAKAAGPEGQRYLQRLFQGSLPAVTSIAAILSLLSGLLLYWRNSGGLQVAWITTGPGLAFTAGGVAALVAGYIGLNVSRRAALRLAALGQQVQAAGSPPTPAQMAEMQSLAATVSRAGRWVAVLLLVALALMAVAQNL